MPLRDDCSTSALGSDGPSHNDSAPREANLDGVLHVSGECCGEHSIRGRRCPLCGGRVHVEPVISGDMEVCEDCPGESAGYWRPRGTYLTHTRDAGVGVATSMVYGEVGGASAVMAQIDALLVACRDRDDRPAPVLTKAESEFWWEIESWLRIHASDPGYRAVRSMLGNVATAIRISEKPRGRAVAVDLAGVASPAPALPGVVERELSDLRAEVQRTRPLVNLLRRVRAARLSARHTLTRHDRDLFDCVEEALHDYDAVSPADRARAHDHPDESGTVAGARSPSGRLPTAEDYEEAMLALRSASGQLVPDGNSCAVCGDSGHQAFECRDNPVVALIVLEAVRGRLRDFHEMLHQVGDVLGV